ncbi:hypothetical protein L2W58_08200 [Dethiosulfovibrio sp. F2B]|uniref:hypothetical protein n=1 Tax=Dethiosulfovibrio faecalis TaxID=2720018 RepID=UPI001F3CFA05|nr:hypothetical protein [Dethiosulfovibrio faecalis]MCF4151783.1 hypothetical protein [Dethiosulfovibrio faecalis]
MNGTWGSMKLKELEDLCFLPYEMKRESARRGETNRLRLIDEYKKSPASVAAESEGQSKMHQNLILTQRSR